MSSLLIYTYTKKDFDIISSKDIYIYTNMVKPHEFWNIFGIILVDYLFGDGDA